MYNGSDNIFSKNIAVFAVIKKKFRKFATILQ